MPKTQLFGTAGRNYKMLKSIHNLLSSNNAQHILHLHPNDLDADLFNDDDQWPEWQNIVADYHADQPSIPLVASIRKNQISREPIALDVCIPQSTFGMSPKKHHEVSRMTQFIANMDLPVNVHIVDVGAGQGYLTRALHSHFGGAPALALDNDLVQTHGSLSRGHGVTGITHRTIHLTPSSLISTIDDWIPSSTTPIPVLIVALHACGSLTPDLFRAALSVPNNHTWYPAAIIAVGCCYNLMDPHLDFPLSQNTPKLSVPMPASAFQMAAQIPDTWLVSPDRLASTALAVRKVVWRALLGRIYAFQVKDVIDVTGTGSTPTMRRLGRLHDSAYSSWSTFLKIASQRIGVDLSSYSSNSEDLEPPNPTLQCHLSSLHILRCLIGPVVESYIILDRVDWLKEELAATEGSMMGYEVQAVNLFDQKTGSGRNVALVVRPGGAKT